jgi:hypothetical protein
VFYNIDEAKDDNDDVVIVFQHLFHRAQLVHKVPSLAVLWEEQWSL